MKKLVVMLLTASMLLSACGSAASGKADQKEPAAAETTEAAEPAAAEAAESAAAEAAEPAAAETAEPAEAAAEAAEAAEPAEAAQNAEAAEQGQEGEGAEDELSRLLPVENEAAKETAEQIQEKMGGFESISSKEEKNDYAGEVVPFAASAYVFSIPAVWEVEDDRTLVLENESDSAAGIFMDFQEFDNSRGMTSDQFMAYLEATDMSQVVGLDDIEVSEPERMTMLDGEQGGVYSFTGSSGGMDLEGLFVLAADIKGSRVITLLLMQSVSCEYSHFEDFKTFVSTMVRQEAAAAEIGAEGAESGTPGADAGEPETVIATDFQQVLYDSDGLKVEITGADTGGFGQYIWHASIENDTDTALMFKFEDVCVNGMMVDPYWIETVDAGSSGTSDIAWYQSELLKSGIQEPTVFEFTLRVVKEEDWSTVKEEKITVFPKGEAAAAYVKWTPDSDDILLFDTDECRMYITDIDEDYWYGYALNVYVENKTDKVEMFSIQDATVNGVSIDPFWAAEIQPGCGAMKSISWSSSSFEEHGIEQSGVESLELFVKVYDFEEWEELLSDTYKVK